jgi:SAM-dependent methyltransferase
VVLFDVLHHLASPASFFNEAARALAPGGRIVLCEPYVSALSFPVYKLFHDEPVRMQVDPLADQAPSADDKDPFDANQAIPTLLFDRARGAAAFTRRFPGLKIVTRQRLAGLSYPSSGGFRHGPLLPPSVWRLLYRAEAALPPWAFRFIGFRLLVALEKTA